MGIAYSDYYNRIGHLLDDTASLAKSLSLPISENILEKINDASVKLNDQVPLRLVFVGEFSAGKSSIISALTGENIYIDPDVATTRISEYKWNGLSLVDTPGIQAEDVDTDHDLIAREATVGADLVLFVISNELFNQRLANHLSFIISNNGLGLYKKTFIIVNKIDRETNSDEVLIKEIVNVLGTYQEIPIYFCSASKYLQAIQNSSVEMKERFERQSRFHELIKRINYFVDDAGANGRLTTPISLINDSLERIKEALVETNEGKNQLELLRRKRRVFQKLQERLDAIRKDKKQQVYSAVVSQANDSVEQLSELSGPEEFKELFESGLKTKESEISNIYEELEIDSRNAFDSASKELDEIDNSPLGIKVSELDTYRVKTSDISLPKGRPKNSDILPSMLNPLVKNKSLHKILENAGKDSKGIRDIYYTVSKKISNKKFKPWEAVKIGEKAAKWLGRVGKAMPYFAAALDVYVQYNEERKKEEKERYFANLRNGLRSAFIEQARLESEDLEKKAIETYKDPIQEGMNNINFQENQIANASDIKESLNKQVSSIREKITILRNEIYSG